MIKNNAFLNRTQCMSRLKIFIIFCIFLFIVPFAHAEKKIEDGFVLKRVDSHYEPELHYKQVVTLPGTNIKFGAFKYISSAIQEFDEIPKCGFLIDNKSFYFVEETVCSYGDAHYGVYGHYFVMDGYAFGASHNRTMYLFKYDKHSVHLLDVVGEAYVNNADGLMDFRSDYPDIKKYGIDYYWNPVILTAKDIDGDGNPDIELRIYTCTDRVPDFSLYLSIINDKLRVNLKPELYKPLYEEVKRLSEGKSRPIAYYVYGYLIKQISIKEIRTKLRNDKYCYHIIKLLENSGKWDAAFHECSGEKFNLIQYDLDRQ